MEKLKEQIKVVVDARQRALVARDAKTASWYKWEQLNKGLLERVVVTGEQVADAEFLLRELTLQAYEETGNKAPAPGVGIREVTKLDYDKTVAFKWATEHIMALKLDITAFEKIVKASPLDFVRVYQEPQATIATQLEVVG